jgi:uncharacterized membrane protein YcjF (UPF0283 family)
MSNEVNNKGGETLIQSEAVQPRRRIVGRKKVTATAKTDSTPGVMDVEETSVEICNTNIIELYPAINRNYYR